MSYNRSYYQKKDYRDRGDRDYRDSSYSSSRSEGNYDWCRSAYFELKKKYDTLEAENMRLKEELQRYKQIEEEMKELEKKKEEERRLKMIVEEIKKETRKEIRREVALASKRKMELEYESDHSEDEMDEDISDETKAKIAELDKKYSNNKKGTKDNLKKVMKEQGLIYDTKKSTAENIKVLALAQIDTKNK
jgi:hypothetical protein